jgi:glutamate/tyrosine decarboxylase-like PLP-dependent enzyme
MLYASAPTYSLGVVDPIRELGALAQSRGLWFHVDACVGGILGPFVRDLGYPVPDFDLAIPGVTSISADLHKSGYTAKGASVLLFRSEEHRAAGLYEFEAWPTGRYRTHTFTGTRPGGAIAAAWAVLRHLGEEGYRQIGRVVMEARARIEAGLARLPGGWHLWGAPDLWALALGAREVTVEAVARGLTARGWHVARVLDPPGIHLMLTPAHAPFVEEYLGDLEAATLEALRAAPAPRPSPEPTSYA